eukprot:m.47993 g.47993  ORF g.47993 m.47993 type:complete len:88 (-) comp20634_c0_seq2:79-342(-)
MSPTMSSITPPSIADHDTNAINNPVAIDVILIFVIAFSFTLANNIAHSDTNYCTYHVTISPTMSRSMQPSTSLSVPPTMTTPTGSPS